MEEDDGYGIERGFPSVACGFPTLANLPDMIQNPTASR